jgi:hypothetical protein
LLLPQFFDLSRRIRTLAVMLSDPGVWLFGLAVGLFLAGILGVVLSTRRVPPNEAQEVPGVIADPGSERRLLELEAEVERLRAERDELRGVLGRLVVLLEERRAHLVTTGDDGEHRGGGG